MSRPTFSRAEANALAKHIVAAPHSYTLQVGEYNEHQCSVLFFDLCNFTNISWSLTTQAILEILQPFFAATGAYVARAGGLIDKYPGDGVVAFIPRDYSSESNTIADDALDCAAQVMGWFYKSFRPSIELPKASHKLELAVGIDAGRIAIAHVGSPIHSELILLGDELTPET